MGLVIGHQGGWDEVLFVFVPVSLFAGLLWLANKRAMAMQDADGDELDGHSDPTL